MTSDHFLTDTQFFYVQNDRQSSTKHNTYCQNTSQTRPSRDTKISNESFTIHTNENTELKIREENQETV